MPVLTPETPIRRVGMISLGCPKNLVDAEIMLGQLQQDAGHVEITSDLEEADVVIVNTCGFIDAAKQESIDTILEIANRKGQGVERLIVTGCMVQKYRTDLQESIPEIDAFVGLDHLEKITQAVTGLSADELAPTRRKMSQRLYEDFPRVLAWAVPWGSTRGKSSYSRWDIVRGRARADAAENVPAAVRRLPPCAHPGHRPRVSQSVRGLLESVHVLRDSADARQVPFALDRRHR